MRHLFVVALATIVFFSCKKNNSTLENDKAQLNTIFSSNKSETQTFTINASLGGSVVGTQGSRYIIPANSLVNQNGTPVSGNITVQLIECLKPAEMIFTKVLPVSNGEPLFSGGEYKISMNQNGNPIKFAPNMNGEMKLPQFGLNNTGMDIFFGNPIENNNNNVNWNQLNKDSGTQQNNFLLLNGDTISIFSDSTDIWCNADRFLTSPNYKNFQIKVDGAEINNENTFAHAIYTTYNGAWPLNPISNTFSENHVPDIPVVFVVFGVYDGKFKAGTLAATPAEGGVYNVSLQETTPAALKTLINSF